MSNNDNSQKTQEVLEQIGKLKNKGDAQTFVEVNLSWLIESAPEIRVAIDRKWKDFTGQYLFMPVTSLQQPENKGPLHPKGSKYRSTRRVVSIDWDKVKETRKAGKQFFPVEYYHLVGIMPDGSRQEIGKKLDPDQMQAYISKETAAKILKSGPNMKGNVKCDEEVSMVGYWEVIFSNKSSPNDTDEVFLTHEGVCLQIKRNIPVILPGYYLEVSDNGIYPKYIQSPQQSRKITAWVQFFPYTALREATEQEYIMGKNKGDAIERDERRRREVTQ